MMRRYGLCALVLLAGLTVSARSEVKLEWKFKEGDKLYVETTTMEKQAIDLLGNKIDQETESTTVTSFTILKKEKDSVVLEQKVESIKVKQTGGLGGNMAKFAEQLKGAAFKVTLDSTGNVAKFEGYNEFIKKLAGDNEKTATLLRALLPEESIKQDAVTTFAFLPGKPVNKGDQWKQDQILSLGPLGSFKANQEYRFVGKTTDGEEISVNTKMTYMAPKDNQGGLPFKITKGDFKTDEAKGTIVFDPNTGRLVRQEMKLRQTGTLTVEALGQTGDLELKSDRTTKMRLLDKPPKD